jgi:hypothetical protein
VAFDANQPRVASAVAVPVIRKMIKFTWLWIKDLPPAATRAFAAEEAFNGLTVLRFGFLAEPLPRPRW